MPDQRSHLQQVNRNIGFLRALYRSKEAAGFGEWIVTLQFYTCLHVIEAICATQNIHFWRHENRNDKIFSLRTLFSQEFCQRYIDLYTLSRKGRYLSPVGQQISPSDISDCEKAFDFIIEYANKNYGLNIEGPLKSDS